LVILTATWGKDFMQRSQLKTNYLGSKTTASHLTEGRITLGCREIETLKLLASEIGFLTRPGLTLLDLGCADRFCEPACLEKGLQYIGLDYSDVDFETQNFPLEDQSVDIAMSLAVIEHLKDPELFLLEIFRVLKPGGLIYLSTPNFQLDWKYFYNDPTHVRPYTPISLEQLLDLHGFSESVTFPGMRCKPIWLYRGPYRYFKAYYLLPFRGDSSALIPSWLKGRSRSMFALAMKPNSKSLMNDYSAR